MLTIEDSAKLRGSIKKSKANYNASQFKCNHRCMSSRIVTLFGPMCRVSDDGGIGNRVVDLLPLQLREGISGTVANTHWLRRDTK